MLLTLIAPCLMHEGGMSHHYYHYYLHQGGIIFMAVCLSVRLFAGLHKYYWLEPHEQSKDMGLVQLISH